MQINQNDAKWLDRTHGVIFFPRISAPVTVTGETAAFETCSQHRPAAFMPLGAYSYTRSYCAEIASIGRYCSIGAGLQVMGESHPTDWISSSPVFYRSRRAGAWQSARSAFPPYGRGHQKPEIGHDVWIGDDVLLAHGVKIGTGAVIAARSVVTRDVPPYAIVAGSPARVKRMRFDDEIIAALLASGWWEWPVSAWDDCDPRDVKAFIDHAAKIANTTSKRPEKRITIQQLLETRKGQPA